MDEQACQMVEVGKENRFPVYCASKKFGTRKDWQLLDLRLNALSPISQANRNAKYDIYIYEVLKKDAWFSMIKNNPQEFHVTDRSAIMYVSKKVEEKIKTILSINNRDTSIELHNPNAETPPGYRDENFVDNIIYKGQRFAVVNLKNVSRAPIDDLEKLSGNIWLAGILGGNIAAWAKEAQYKGWIYNVGDYINAEPIKRWGNIHSEAQGIGIGGGASL